MAFIETFKGISAKKDGEDATLDGKGIAARILGPSKPVCFTGQVLLLPKQIYSLKAFDASLMAKNHVFLNNGQVSLISYLYWPFYCIYFYFSNSHHPHTIHTDLCHILSRHVVHTPPLLQVRPFFFRLEKNDQE